LGPGIELKVFRFGWSEPIWFRVTVSKDVVGEDLEDSGIGLELSEVDFLVYRKESREGGG